MEGFLILGLTLIPTMKRLRTSVLRRPACGIYLQLRAHPTPSPLKDQPISNFDQCPPNPTLPQMTVMLHAVVTPSPLKDQPISKFDQCPPNPTPPRMTVMPHAVGTQQRSSRKVRNEKFSTVASSLQQKPREGEERTQTQSRATTRRNESSTTSHTLWLSLPTPVTVTD